MLVSEQTFFFAITSTSVTLLVNEIDKIYPYKMSIYSVAQLIVLKIDLNRNVYLMALKQYRK